MLTKKQEIVLEVIKGHPLEEPGWMALLADMTPQAFGRVAQALVKKKLVTWDHFPANRSPDGKERITYRVAK